MQWIENNKTFPRTRIFHEKSSFKWVSFKAVDVIIHMRIINQEKESTLIRLRYHKECLFSQYLGCFFLVLVFISSFTFILWESIRPYYKHDRTDKDVACSFFFRRETFAFVFIQTKTCFSIHKIIYILQENTGQYCSQRDCFYLNKLLKYVTNFQNYWYTGQVWIFRNPREEK